MRIVSVQMYNFRSSNFPGLDKIAGELFPDAHSVYYKRKDNAQRCSESAALCSVRQSRLASGRMSLMERAAVSSFNNGFPIDFASSYTQTPLSSSRPPIALYGGVVTDSFRTSGRYEHCRFCGVLFPDSLTEPFRSQRNVEHGIPLLFSQI